MPSKKIMLACSACLSLIAFLPLLQIFRDFRFSSWQKTSWGKKGSVCVLSSCEPSGSSPLYGGTSNKTPKWGVLLTMCFQRDTVESYERYKALYETVIKKWLAGTELPIFVIETSGYELNFHHSRLW